MKDEQIEKAESKQVKPVNIDRLSYSSIPIKLLNGETGCVLAVATGFFFKSRETYFLITNWHNVTGFDPGTGERIGTHLGSPTVVEVPFLKQKRPFIAWGRWRISLYKEQRPVWFIHKIYGKKVDVVAIELGINDNPDGVFSHAINEVEFDNFRPRVADGMFILGFPNNLNSGGNLPLWKRGSIASEPDIDLDGLPKMLVDSASRPGMSGSPVIYRRQGIHNMPDSGSINDNSIFGEIQNFVGIYSGRIKTKTELDTQLGIVWKANVIQEIIDGKYQEDIYYPDISSLDDNKSS